MLLLTVISLIMIQLYDGFGTFGNKSLHNDGMFSILVVEVGSWFGSSADLKQNIKRWSKCKAIKLGGGP